MADGEADDGCAAGSSQRHAEESCLCGDADGFCPTGSDFPGEQVRDQTGEQCVWVKWGGGNQGGSFHMNRPNTQTFGHKISIMSIMDAYGTEQEKKAGTKPTKIINISRV